jgi:hypothetical protein
MITQSSLSKHSDVPCETLTLADVAAMLGISYTAAHETLRRDGELIGIRPLRINRSYRFPKAMVHAVLGLTDA